MRSDKPLFWIKSDACAATEFTKKQNKIHDMLHEEHVIHTVHVFCVSVAVEKSKLWSWRNKE